MSIDEKTALARRFVAEVAELAAKYGLNFFVVTDGASGIRNSGNPAVAHARKTHMEWECANNVDSAHDWSEKPNKSQSARILKRESRILRRFPF